MSKFEARKIIESDYDLKKELMNEYENNNEREEKQKDIKKTQAEILIELLNDLTCFHDEVNQPYAIIPVDGHNEVYPVKGAFL